MNVSNLPNEPITSTNITPLVSDEVLWYFRMFVVGIFCQLIAVFGTITNIINILVFVKMGFKDPINVSLFGLSISDFGSCLTTVWVNMCFTPGFSEADFPFTPIGVHYLTGAWPHIMFVKITSIITSVIAVERCLCVAMPLKVKGMITTKTVTFVTVGIFIFVVLMAAPVYFVNSLEYVYFSNRNQSIYTLTFSEHRDEVEIPLFFIYGIITAIIVFVTTIIATIVLVYQLNKQAKWRLNNTSISQNTNEGSQISTKDTKLSKMVAMLSVLFIVCFSPQMIYSVAMQFVPELKVGGAYEKMLYTTSFSLYVFESVNGSLNTFIYLYMSSKFKVLFNRIILRKRSVSQAMPESKQRTEINK